MESIAVLGSGAMGSLYGGHLAEAGHDVTLIDIWKEHVSEINKHGLSIESPNGDVRKIEATATTELNNYSDVDIVILFVKSTHTRKAVSDIHIGDSTEVLTLQNGLGNSAIISEYCPDKNIIRGVSTHGATLLGPGKIRHAGSGTTAIGRYFVDNDSRVQELADIMSDAHLDTIVSDNVRKSVWEKVLVNVGLNAATALAGVYNGALANTEYGKELLTAAVSEAVEVAQHEGIDIDDSVEAHVREVAESTGPNKSSMLQDIEAGRKTEIERINGEVVDRADSHDLSVPVNRTLTNLILLSETDYAVSPT